MTFTFLLNVSWAPIQVDSMSREMTVPATYTIKLCNTIPPSLAMVIGVATKDIRDTVIAQAGIGEKSIGDWYRCDEVNESLQVFITALSLDGKAEVYILPPG